MFTHSLVDRDSISGQVIPKTQKTLLDTAKLNTQHYKVHIKGKVKQSRESSSDPSLHFGVVAINKGTFESPSTMVPNFTSNGQTVLFLTLQCNINHLSAHSLNVKFLLDP